MAKVSVMFMSYNHGPYVYEAIESVLKQTYKDFDVLFSDDCSTDNTLDVIGKIKDDRLIIHSFDKNKGATINMRYLYENCTGEYLALINSDDVWDENHLEKCVDFLDKNSDYAAVFSWASFIDEESNVIDPCASVFKENNRSQSEWVKRLFVGGNCICHPSMLIRKTAYDDIGFLNLGMRQLPDYNFWTRLVKKYNIYILQEVTVRHRRCIRTEQNTSAPLLNNSIRDINESLFTLLHYWDDMDDTLFVEAFHEFFINKDASTHVELLCEKFFLIYNEKYYMKWINKQAAFLFYLDNSSKLEFVNTMTERYSFSLNDFHLLGSEIDTVGYRKIAESYGQKKDRKFKLWKK